VNDAASRLALGWLGGQLVLVLVVVRGLWQNGIIRMTE